MQLPPSVSLPDLECVRCPERFGQIQKVAFQRISNDDGTKNKFSATSGFSEINSLCSHNAPLSSAVTVLPTIPAIQMQPTPALTAQEHPVILHKRNVSRATIKNAVYLFCRWHFFIIGGVLVRGIYIKIFLRRPQVYAVFLHQCHDFGGGL